MGSPVPVCFNATTHLMPMLRAETARRLSRSGVRQDRIAEQLGVSQAMVSKYLRSTPRADTRVSATLVARLVQDSVERALAFEKSGRDSPWCPICPTLADHGLGRASQPLTVEPECIRPALPGGTLAHRDVLAELGRAEAALRRLPIARLVPEVRSNLAMAAPDATTARDVAAFPGRLLLAGGRLQAAASPAFASSRHLADLLLRVRQAQPDTHAILNLRLDASVRAAARRAGLRVHPLRRARAQLAVPARLDPPADALEDVGAFGIEPALYVLGSTAVEAVRHAGQILQHLSPERA